MPSLTGDGTTLRHLSIFRSPAFALLLLGFLSIGGCSVGPKYVKPTMQIPPAYMENANWKTAQPGDQVQKGNWWEIFQDPQLNALEEKLTVSNQSLRAAVDRFQEVVETNEIPCDGQLLPPQLDLHMEPIGARRVL